MADDSDMQDDNAAWGAGGGEPDPFAGSERILNQDEIDSLLGFDLSDDESSDDDVSLVL